MKCIQCHWRRPLRVGPRLPRQCCHSKPSPADNQTARQNLHAPRNVSPRTLKHWTSQGVTCLTNSWSATGKFTSDHLRMESFLPMPFLFRSSSCCGFGKKKKKNSKAGGQNVPGTIIADSDNYNEPTFALLDCLLSVMEDEVDALLSS